MAVIGVLSTLVRAIIVLLKNHTSVAVGKVLETVVSHLNLMPGICYEDCKCKEHDKRGSSRKFGFI